MTGCRRKTIVERSDLIIRSDEGYSNDEQNDYEDLVIWRLCAAERGKEEGAM